MRRELTVAAIVLPLLTIVLGIVRAEVHYARSRDFTFAVAGYDPRDLLRGQYLQYRLVLDEQPGNGCSNGEADCCLCLNDRGTQSVASVQRMACSEARASCDGVMHTQYLSSLGRYYISESAAKQGVFLPQAQDAASSSARIVLSIDGAGKPQVKTLTVNGKAIGAR
jgi:hypothetical protein